MSHVQQIKYMFQLQFSRMKGIVVVMAILQIIIALGIAIGYTYLFSDPDGKTTLFLATGAPTIVLIMTGLVILPMQNATAKIEGYNDFIRTLPINRFAVIAADTIMWFTITLPGFIIATTCTHFMFKPGYAISWSIVPVYLLAALTCIGVGYGYSFVMDAELAMALSQVIAFGALMFSPINFPLERLPRWLQVLHKILPIDSMAQIMRTSMASTTFATNSGEYIKLIIWCLAGYGSAIYVLNKK